MLCIKQLYFIKNMQLIDFLIWLNKFKKTNEVFK